MNSTESSQPTPGQNYNRRLRRLTTIFAVIVVAVAIVAGFTGYEIRAVSTPTSSATSVSLTYFDDLAPSESSFMSSSVIPLFEHQYPNVTVVYSDISATAMVNEVEALEQGHDVGTTVIAEDNMVIGELVYGGYLMNMSSFASSIEPSTMIPSMAGIAQYEVKAFGGTYFIPLRANVPLVWYNATALTAAGLHHPPANTAQLMSDAQTLDSFYHGGQVMFQGHGGASTPTELFQWLTQFGGNPIAFNDTGDIQAFQYLYNLSAYFNPSYTSGYWGSYTGLANGAYSILDYQWPYIYSNLVGLGMPNSAIGVYAGPNGTVNSDHIIGGDVLAIPKGVTNLWAAQTFSQFLLSTPVQQMFIENLSWPAVNQAAYTGLNASLSKTYGAIESALSNPVFRPPVPWITEWNTLMDNAWSTIIVNHGSYASIASVLSNEHQQLYNYLVANFGQTTATEYNEGMFGPLIV